MANTSTKIQPYILGSGRAAQAIEKSLYVIGVCDPSLEIHRPVMIKRSDRLPRHQDASALSLLILANPHGLHAERLLEADGLGYDLIVSEKPVCVSLEEVERLRGLKTKIAVCHVYRQMWGLQTLRAMVECGEMGEIISIEGRYWQSSAAQKALFTEPPPANWKNDIKLSGPYDVLLDIGSHWADAASFLIGASPQRTEVWRSYVNAEAPHRDTHMHLQMQFASGVRGLASISKTVHGAGNHFEINVIGSKKSATWKFLEPDTIEVGEGSLQIKVARADMKMGSQQWPFHGLGWLEGYAEIIRQGLNHVLGRHHRPYPTLAEGLRVVQGLIEGTNPTR